MAIEPPDISFTPNLTNPNQLIAMIGALNAALQQSAILKAEDIAAIPDADSEARHGLFDEYTKSIIRATKGLLTEGASISDEAPGIGAALDLIGIVFGGIRGQL